MTNAYSVPSDSISLSICKLNLQFFSSSKLSINIYLREHLNDKQINVSVKFFFVNIYEAECFDVKMLTM